MIRYLLRLTGIFFFILISSKSFIAQESNIRFNRITINDGLSLSSVYCIYQDRKGFMWFGTEDGLNKYDGKKFIIYRNNPLNENSLSDKWTELIYEDNIGNLWFGSKSGLTRFDPVKEYFTQFTSDEYDLNSLSNDTITALLEHKNMLWIGTVSGLDVYNLKSNVLLRLNKDLSGICT